MARNVNGDISASAIPPDQTQLPYPKSIFFIVINQFCERFSHYGMKTILSIYLTDMLLFSQTEAKIIFHTFILLVYFSPLFGAMLADSLLGTFRTIFYMSIIYVLGNIMLVLAATPALQLPQIAATMLALVLIAIGCGAIKPCVPAFGGDQFILPEQEKQLIAFFSLLYFAFNCGNVITTFISPLLREQSCFGSEHCFTFGFGVPAVAMILSLIIFGLGRPLYKIHKLEGNVFIEVSKCIGYAIKRKGKSNEKKNHWLDHAEDRYGEQLVCDIKATFRVLILYVPVPFFWALFDQQSTGWVFMARQMIGNIGFYTILPDQMQLTNPLLVLVFIPLCDYAIYPVLNKMNLLKTPLQRMVSGGVLTALSFGISAVVSMAIEAENPVLTRNGIGELIIYNNYECDLMFAYQFDSNELFTPENLTKGRFKIFNFKLEETTMLEYNISNGECIPKNYLVPLEIELKEGKSIGLLLDGGLTFEDDRQKDINGFPSLRVVTNKKNYNELYIVSFEINDALLLETNTNDQSRQQVLKPDDYTTIKLEGKVIGGHNFRPGGVYTVVFNIDDDDISKTKMQVFEISPHNTVHMLWLVPQYAFLSMGEIMFVISGMEFSYSQAPTSMKSLLQGFWLLNDAIGNLIVVIIESIEIFKKQSLYFFLYAGLMCIDMSIFALIAMRYKYVMRNDEDVNRH